MGAMLGKRFALAIAMAGGASVRPGGASDAPIQLGQIIIYGAKDATTLNDTSSSVGVGHLRRRISRTACCGAFATRSAGSPM